MHNGRKCRIEKRYGMWEAFYAPTFCTGVFPTWEKALKYLTTVNI